MSIFELGYLFTITPLLIVLIIGFAHLARNRDAARRARASARFGLCVVVGSLLAMWIGIFTVPYWVKPLWPTGGMVRYVLSVTAVEVVGYLGVAAGLWMIVREVPAAAAEAGTAPVPDDE